MLSLVLAFSGLKAFVAMLLIVAFLMQIAGADGVIQDVRHSIANMRGLQTDLAAADSEADRHLAGMERMEAGNPMISAIGEQLGQRRAHVPWQVGPAAMLQQRALVTYVTKQNDVSDVSRWTAVGLLVVGLLIGFVANELSLFV